MTAPNYFFTSDNHFCHRNIIEYCKRPFANPDEMDEEMIDRWNAVVKPHDMVYHVGDVSLLKKHSMNHDALRHKLARLHGKKHIVWGNHDYGVKHTIQAAGFHELGELYELHVPPESNGGVKQKIVLCHYAMRVWNESHYGSYHLYGHSHGTLPDDPASRSCDVGVDSWDFYPVTMEQINAHMAKKTWKPIDHHKGKKG